MIVELTSAQRDLLLRLVDEALEEIGPEIHHTTVPAYRENLKRERQELTNLRMLLSDVPPLEAMGTVSDTVSPS